VSGWSFRLGRISAGGNPEQKKKCELSEFWARLPQEGNFLSRIFIKDLYI
jgi:hypothetical protein